MRIACCQFDIAWEDKPTNYERAASRVARAGLPRGALLALPELFATGFSMNTGAIAEPLEGPTAHFLSDLARAHGISGVGGVAVGASPDGPRNEALAFGPEGKLLGQYAKSRLFSLAGEPAHYCPGTGPCGFDWEGVRVSMAICYDLRFPEIFRHRARDEKQSDLFIVIANWPVARIEHWTALLRARAIENQAYVAGVNRCGRDPHLQYNGRSQIIDPHGRVIADAGDRDEIIAADLDLSDLRDYRRDFPALRDGLEQPPPPDDDRPR